MSQDRKFEKTLPISWTGWDEAGSFAIQFNEDKTVDIKFIAMERK